MANQNKEIDELKKVNKDLMDENNKLTDYIKQKEQRALIRKYALNVEKQLKIVIADQIEITSLMTLLGVTEEEFDDDDTYFLRLGNTSLTMLWLRLEDEKRNLLMDDHFDGMTFNVISQAIRALKEVFNTEAHLTQFEGSAVSPDDIKLFIEKHFDYTQVHSNKSRRKKTSEKPNTDLKEVYPVLINYLAKQRN